MSDRIAVMNHGRIEQCGPPEEVYERPATTFVAGFIGVSNLMPGVGQPVQRRPLRVKLDTGVEVEADRNGLSQGERCHAVVRPEKLQIDAATARPRATAAERRGRGRELGLPRHRDADRRPPPRRREDDRARSQRRRGRARAAARRRAPRAPVLGARAHPPCPGVGSRSGDERPRRASEHARQSAERDVDGAAWRSARCSPPGLTAASRPAIGGQRRATCRPPRPGEPAGELTISNWPLYIDKADGSRRLRGRRPASTSTTSRTSTTTSSSSARCSRCSTRASPAAGDHGRHRLHGEDHERPGLPADARQDGDPDVDENLLPSSRARPSTPNASSRSRGRAG